LFSLLPFTTELLLLPLQKNPPVVSALLGPFLPLLLSRSPLFCSKNFPPPLVFQPSLSFPQKNSPSFLLSPSLSFGASPFYRGERSWSFLLVRLGSKSCCGWSAIGRDCRGSAPLISTGRAAGRGTVSKRHCSNSFFLLLLLLLYFFLFVGTQKRVTTHMENYSLT